jgi:hypothetical protein
MGEPLRFEVESMLPSLGAGVLLVRQLSAGEFALGDAPTLGGFPIQRWVTSPRALRPDGSPREDLFAFTLRSKKHMSAFTVGQVVELEGLEGGA